MCWKKVILPGIIVGIIILVFSFAFSWIFGLAFPSVNAEMQNTDVFRSWDDPLMMAMFLYYFILGIVLAWLWDKTKSVFKGSIGRRGTRFGLTYFIVASIPGMFITWTSMQISFLTIFSWLILALINAILAGIFLARMNR